MTQKQKNPRPQKNIAISGEVWKELKLRAAAEEITLSDLVEKCWKCYKQKHPKP